MVDEAVAGALTLYLEDFGMPLLMATFTLLDMASTSTGRGRLRLARLHHRHLDPQDSASP